MQILTRRSYRIKPDEQVFCLWCNCRLWPRDRVFPLGEDSFCSPMCRKAFEHALETHAETEDLERELTLAGSLIVRMAPLVALVAVLAGCRVEVTVDRLEDPPAVEQTEKPQPQPATRYDPHRPFDR